MSQDALGDPHGMARFIAAQAEPGAGFAQARRELAAGAKRSHWMWYVFPQLRGLGHSAMAQHYGLANLAEAQAYAQHGVLGERLRECTRLLLALPAGTPAEVVMGEIDAMKLRSCMTLFERADAGQEIYARLLEKWFGGERDGQTLRLLGPQ